MKISGNYPQRVIGLTEETVEFLYDIGREDLLVGVSVHVRRPEEARKLPIITSFTKANIEKIKELKPDLIVGFSDIQKDIARDLIGEGLNVYISNQRSLEEILSFLLQFGAMIGESEKTQEYIEKLKTRIEGAKALAKTRKRSPKVYLEEWDEPMICGISWFSEIVELCGAVDIFSKKSKGSLAKERFVTSDEVIALNPDIILASWCGKKVSIEKICEREGWESISAVQEKSVFELEPEVFLQPGPAPIISGLDVIEEILNRWENSKNSTT